MFGGIFDGDVGALSAAQAATTVVAVLAAGMAIKLMDDFIDRRMDALAGVRTWAARLGDGTLPYALAALGVGMLVDASVAGPLFLSAYAVGMSHDLRRRQPSGLLGWHESALAVGVGALLAGLIPTAAALAAITFVQCVDDVADAHTDRLRGHRSFVRSLGAVETLLLGLAALIVACALAPLLATAVVAATAAVEWVAGRTAPGVDGRRLRGWPW